MPLSPEAQKALNDSARISQEKETKRNEEKNKIEQERIQAEEEFNQYAQEVAQYQTQIAELEALEKQELDKASQLEAQRQLEAEQEETRRQELAQAKIQLETEKTQARAELNLTYDQQIEALGSAPSKYIYKPKYYTNRYTGHTRLIGYTRERNYKASKQYSDKVTSINRERSLKSQQLELKYLDVPDSFKTKARREYGTGSGFTSTTISALAQRYYNSFLAESESKRQSSITTAQSRAIQERERIQTVVREYEQKRDSLGIKLNEGQTRLNSTQTKLDSVRGKLEQAEKKRPEIKDSSFFKGHENSAIPQSIIGTTKEKSAQAKFTLKEIEKQQKDLEYRTRTASSGKEAIKIRQEARAENPYVGTANVVTHKGAIKERAGVIVDLKLDKKYDQGSIDSKVAHPETLQTFEASTQTDRLTESKAIQEDVNLQFDHRIPVYVFTDEDGNERQATTKELFSLASMLIEKEAKLPSQADKLWNKYLQDNKQKVIETQNKPQESGEVISVIPDKGFTKGFADVGTEILAVGNNVIRPDKKIPVPETLEGAFFTDLIGHGSNALGIENYNEARTSDYIKEKIKTQEGTEELAGSVFGAIAINYALASIPGALYVKTVARVVNKVETNQLIKIVDKVIPKLKQTEESIKYETKLKEQFPEMPEPMIRKLVKDSDKENIVGYEILNSRTALIKRGTEGSEEVTPYVVVRTGKNPRATVYETYTAENPGAFKNILVSGKQAGELEKGVKVTEDISKYPSTRDNVLKVDNEKELAKVGIKNDVGQEGLIDNPKLLIEKIETQPVRTGDLITETQRLDPIKSMNKDVKQLFPDDVKPTKGDEVTPYKKTFESEIKADKIDLPPTKKADEVILKEKPNTSDSKRLENFIKAEEKGKETIRGEKTKLISYEAGALGTSAGISAKTKVYSDINLDTKSITAQKEQQTPEISTDVTTRSDIIQQEKIEIASKLEEVQKQKPSLDPKYSLIVEGSLQQDTATVPVYKLETKLDVLQKIDPVIPDPTKKTPFTPARPSAIISLDLGLDETKPNKHKSPKPKISYYRWNVNTESVGRYLPTKADLYTGRTDKVIKKIDKLERKVNDPRYQTKQTKKEKRSFKQSMKVFTKPSGSLESKMDIQNISAPKGKKEKKFLKKFDINFGF